MKKKTALILLLCAVCIVVIGVCIMGSVSQFQQQSQTLAQEEEAQQELDSYSDELTQAFDDLTDTEGSLIGSISEQQEAGVSDREILISTIDSLRASIHSVADIDAPDEATEAQSYFTTAAQSYDEMADEVIALLEDESLSSDELSSAILALLPDALSAFDDLESGVSALEESGIDVPESAQQLTDTLDSLIESGIDSILTTAE